MSPFSKVNKRCNGSTPESQLFKESEQNSFNVRLEPREIYIGNRS